MGGGPDAAGAALTGLLVLLRLTFYLATGHLMADGTLPEPGAAACSRSFPLGTVIGLATDDGWLVVTCRDRGRIDSELWIDVYCADRACMDRIRAVGPYSYGIVAGNGTLPAGK